MSMIINETTLLKSLGNTIKISIPDNNSSVRFNEANNMIRLSLISGSAVIDINPTSSQNIPIYIDSFGTQIEPRNLKVNYCGVNSEKVFGNTLNISSLGDPEHSEITLKVIAYNCTKTKFYVNTKGCKFNIFLEDAKGDQARLVSNREATLQIDNIDSIINVYTNEKSKNTVKCNNVGSTKIKFCPVDEAPKKINQQQIITTGVHQTRITPKGVIKQPKIFAEQNKTIKSIPITNPEIQNDLTTPKTTTRISDVINYHGYEVTIKGDHNPDIKVVKGKNYILIEVFSGTSMIRVSEQYASQKKIKIVNRSQLCSVYYHNESKLPISENRLIIENHGKTVNVNISDFNRSFTKYSITSTKGQCNFLAYALSKKDIMPETIIITNKGTSKTFLNFKDVTILKGLIVNDENPNHKTKSYYEQQSITVDETDDELEDDFVETNKNKIADKSEEEQAERQKLIGDNKTIEEIVTALRTKGEAYTEDDFISYLIDNSYISKSFRSTTKSKGFFKYIENTEYKDGKCIIQRELLLTDLGYKTLFNEF